ncbi:hypothetical protein [Streptomyces olindensis]|uniref:hypothetical protein n=1 Tax=Streptomyces olindensis TaxID=358823 RepID=UPI003668D8BE
MSTPDIPPPVVRAARELAASLARTSLQPATQEVLRHLASSQHRRSAVVTAYQQRMGQQWAERVAAILAPGQAARQEAVQRVVDQVGRSWSERMAAAAASQLRFDTPGLDRILDDVRAWHQLSEDERASAAAVLEDSYEQATAEPSAQAPTEMVTQLEQTVREFESSQAGLIPPRVQRALFVYFVGLLVIVALMQASFTSDTADEILSKGADLAPYAGLATLAAGSAWDTFARRPEEDEESDDPSSADSNGDQESRGRGGQD